MQQNGSRKIQPKSKRFETEHMNAPWDFHNEKRIRWYREKAMENTVFIIAKVKLKIINILSFEASIHLSAQ